MNSRIGKRVRILGGMAEFVGKTGRIVDKEGPLYRVELDQPVEISGVGLVADDLWESRWLSNLRTSPTSAPLRRRYLGALMAAAAVVIGLAGAASAQGFDPACRYGSTRADGSPCRAAPAAPAPTPGVCAFYPAPDSSTPKCGPAEERAWCAAHPDVVARKAWKWQHGVLSLDDPDAWTPNCGKQP